MKGKGWSKVWIYLSESKQSHMLPNYVLSETHPQLEIKKLQSSLLIANRHSILLRATDARKAVRARPSNIGFHPVLHCMMRHSCSCRDLPNSYLKGPISAASPLEILPLAAFFFIGIEASRQFNTYCSQCDNIPPKPIVIRNSDEGMFIIAVTSAPVA